MKKYRVTLADDERERLADLIATGRGAASRLAHARILLKADQTDGGPAWPDEEVAEALEISPATVARIRRRYVEEGLDSALDRHKPRTPSRPRKFDGRSEARLIAIACSEPPEGRDAWTMRLLADRLVELEVFESVSDETVRRVLKKTLSSRG